MIVIFLNFILTLIVFIVDKPTGVSLRYAALRCINKFDLILKLYFVDEEEDDVY